MSNIAISELTTSVQNMDSDDLFLVSKYNEVNQTYISGKIKYSDLMSDFFNRLEYLENKLGEIENSNIKINLSQDSYSYSGYEDYPYDCQPQVNVIFNGETLVQNTDYTVTYNNNSGTFTDSGSVLAYAIISFTNLPLSDRYKYFSISYTKESSPTVTESYFVVAGQSTESNYCITNDLNGGTAANGSMTGSERYSMSAYPLRRVLKYSDGSTKYQDWLFKRNVSTNFWRKGYIFTGWSFTDGDFIPVAKYPIYTTEAKTALWDKFDYVDLTKLENRSYYPSTIIVPKTSLHPDQSYKPGMWFKRIAQWQKEN